MPSRQRGANRRPRARRTRARRLQQTQRIIGAVAVASVLLVVLLLTAFGSRRPAPVEAAAPAPSVRLLPAGPPRPQVLAMAGSLPIRLPIPQERVTAIGYHAAGPGFVRLRPLGHQANEGTLSRAAHKLFGGSGRGGLRYYELPGGDGPENSALDVGAAAGTDVYSPVDGTVVSITPYVISGRHRGVRIDVQPTSDPSVVVSLSRLRADPALQVGAAVTASTTKLGTLADLSGVEHQALARYTQDAGNHVQVDVRPAPSLTLP